MTSFKSEIGYCIRCSRAMNFFFFLEEGGGGWMMKLSNFFQLWIQIKTNNNLSPKMWV